MGPRRGVPQPTRLVPGVLGQDFGSSASKLAIAYYKEQSWVDDQGVRHWESVPHVVRVPLRADIDDPEKNNRADAAQYSFPACAAVDPGAENLVTGRATLTRDASLFLKTLFVWGAGITRSNVILRLPGGPALLSATRSRRITQGMISEAVKQHFTLLKRMALAQARVSKVRLEEIVLTFPAFLYHLAKETDPEKKFYDLGKYQKYYVELMKEVWADFKDMKLDWVNEGQAAAVYICEPFDDGNVLDKAAIWSEFSELLTSDNEDDSTGEQWLNNIVIDNGGSSIQVCTQTVFFDDDLKPKNSQSFAPDTGIPGTTGGSHLTNERVRAIIEDQLRNQPAEPGHIAQLLAMYEDQKTDLDFQENTEPLIFHTADDKVSALITPEAITTIFEETFGPVFDLIDTEMERLISLGKPFGVVFCGGSFINIGLRNEVKHSIEHWQGVAEAAGIQIKCIFLPSVDSCPSVAVAAGAAMSKLHVPPVADVLRGSALGIQPQKRVSLKELAARAVDPYDKEMYADFLFSQGCGTPASIKYDLDSQPQANLRFQLVCDPNYYRATASGPGRPSAGAIRSRASRRRVVSCLAAAQGTTTRYHRLSIGPIPRHVNGPRETYDLDFHADSRDLPRGQVIFTIAGKDVDRYAAEFEGEDGVVDEESMSFKFEIRCDKIGGDRDHKNKRWLVILKTDGASKLLAVDRVWDIPQKCAGSCGGIITDQVSICRECKGHGYCEECYDDGRHDHYSSHVFDTINLDG